MSSDLSNAHRCGSETSSNAYAKAVASALMDNAKIASLFFTSLEVADLETALVRVLRGELDVRVLLTVVIVVK